MIQQDPDLLKKLEAEKLEKDKIQNELKANDLALVVEQDQKKQLEQMVQDLESKLVSGGDALAEREKEQASKYRKF